MDKLAEKLAKWFGSAPFIAFHIFWFAAWISLHVALSFDPDWSALTLVVSLEAIFLSLFILRAENVESTRAENNLKLSLKKNNEQLQLLKTINNRLNKKR